MAQQPKTIYNLQNAAGKTVNWTTPVTKIAIISAVAVWVLPGYDAAGSVANPSASPIATASNNDIIDWLYVPANTPVEFGEDVTKSQANQGSTVDVLNYLKVWNASGSAGNVSVNAE